MKNQRLQHERDADQDLALRDLRRHRAATRIVGLGLFGVVVASSAAAAKVSIDERSLAPMIVPVVVAGIASLTRLEVTDFYKSRSQRRVWQYGRALTARTDPAAWQRFASTHPELSERSQSKMGINYLLRPEQNLEYIAGQYAQMSNSRIAHCKSTLIMHATTVGAATSLAFAEQHQDTTRLLALAPFAIGAVMAAGEVRQQAADIKVDQRCYEQQISEISYYGGLRGVLGVNRFSEQV